MNSVEVCKFLLNLLTSSNPGLGGVREMCLPQNRNYIANSYDCSLNRTILCSNYLGDFFCAVNKFNTLFEKALSVNKEIDCLINQLNNTITNEIYDNGCIDQQKLKTMSCIQILINCLINQITSSYENISLNRIPSKITVVTHIKQTESNCSEHPKDSPSDDTESKPSDDDPKDSPPDDPESKLSDDDPKDSPPDDPESKLSDDDPKDSPPDDPESKLSDANTKDSLSDAEKKAMKSSIQTVVQHLEDSLKKLEEKSNNILSSISNAVSQKRKTLTASA